jgi:hypothetical protein
MLPSVYFFKYKTQGKAERTREYVMDGITNIQQMLLQQHNLVSNIRLETYNGENYFHCPPPPPVSSSDTSETPSLK